MCSGISEILSKIDAEGQEKSLNSFRRRTVDLNVRFFKTKWIDLCLSDEKFRLTMKQRVGESNGPKIPRGFVELDETCLHV